MFVDLSRLSLSLGRLVLDSYLEVDMIPWYTHLMESFADFLQTNTAVDLIIDVQNL